MLMISIYKEKCGDVRCYWLGFVAKKKKINEYLCFIVVVVEEALTMMQWRKEK